MYAKDTALVAPMSSKTIPRSHVTRLNVMAAMINALVKMR